MLWHWLLDKYEQSAVRCFDLFVLIKCLYLLNIRLNNATNKDGIEYKKMAKFIAVLSGKGGVGKTTSAINIGLAMTKLGVETIVLDGNLSSPNLSVHLGNTYFPVTIHDVIQGTQNISKAIYNHHSDLKIIPADVAIEAMKQVDFEKLQDNLHDLHLLTKYVVIDGAPGLAREADQILNVADDVLIVTNPDPVSLLDAKRVIQFAKKKGNTIVGVILSKYRRRKDKLKIKDVEDFLNMPVLAVIPHDKRFEDALHKKTPFLHLYPKRKASRAFKKVAEIITGRTEL